MSLYALADHMASKGRNGDSVLVHMTPGEVQGLQALALAHGGSLTINPETGLPEANFLKKLLPAVAGFALNAFVPGLGSAIGGALGVSAAAGTGIAVGGLSALATGSLSRGLMAGLGAYGGAGLAEGLMGAGAGAAQQAAMSGLTQEQIAQRVAEENLANMSTATTAQGVRNQLAADAAKGFASKTASEQLGAGLSAAGADPLGFAKSTAKPLMLAAMGADAMVPTSTKMPSSAQSPSYIRPYIFDQYTQGLQALPVIDASTIRKKPEGMAGGGIVALADGGMSVADLYKTYAGREADPGGLQYWTEKFGGSVDPTEAAAFRAAIAEARTVGTEPMLAQPAAAEAVQNMYRNVLGRDVEQSGLDYWTQQMQQAADPTQVYQEFLAGAQANKEIGRAGLGFEQAVQPYTGYTSSDANTYADEWVRNVLGREVTAADRQQPWYQQLLTTSTPEQTQKAYEDFLRSTGAKTGMDVMQASQLREFTPRTGPTTLFTPSPVPEARTPYGSGPATGIDYQGREVSIATPGDKTVNPDQSVTVTPNIPGRPYGGFTGIEQLKSAYTAGGGSLGQTNLFVPRTVEEMYERYGNTGGSQQAYDYLMGKGAVDIKKPILKTGELMLPYHEVMGLRPRKTFVLPKKPEPKTKVPAATQEEVEDTASTGAAAGGVMRMALGGLGALAGGGQAGYNLGGYSDGGRLLKGPGDGVSDSIPATIGGRQPARLANNEFVIPARIVSELGNGSTDAGARKLYAMMDRVQKARGKTIGKGKIAVDSKADRFLPA